MKNSIIRIAAVLLTFNLAANVYSANIHSAQKYWKKAYSELEYYELKTNRSFSSQVKKTNCFYVINSTYDIRGEIINIPERSVLYFTDGGGLKHGIVIISDNSHLIGGIFEFSPEDVSYYLYSNNRMSSPIIIKDASNIIIEKCIFIYKSKEERPAPSITVYGKRRECHKIIIKDNSFDVSGVGFFCNVKNSLIENNLFKNTIRAIRVETMYDAPPYRNPANITIENNNIEGQDKVLARPLVWISGVKGVFFKNNKIESSTNALFIYCGDGNMALETVHVNNNKFTIRKNDKLDGHFRRCVWVRGKSYPFQKKGKTFGDNVLISGNMFISNEDCTLNKIPYLRAIDVNFVNDIIVCNNIAENFSTFVSLSDDYKDLYERCTCISIINNNVSKTYETPIRVSTDIRHCQIVENLFNCCNENGNYLIDLSKISRITVTDNRLLVPQGKTGYIKIGAGFNKVGINNVVENKE